MLSKPQKYELKKRAHALKPVVTIGNKGLTPAVHTEIDLALHTHALIKVKINGCERDERPALIEEIQQKHLAEVIQVIGKVGVFYRKTD